MKTLILLEGVHASGKTSVLSLLKLKGHACIDELFIDVPTTTMFAPQGLCCELQWMGAWCARVSSAVSTMPEDGMLFVDRSPYSAAVYGKNGDHFEPLCAIIDRLIQEFREHVQIVFVCLDASRDKLFARAQERLRRCPERSKYREDNLDWLSLVMERYTRLDYVWGANKIDTSGLTPVDVCALVETKSSQDAPRQKT